MCEVQVSPYEFATRLFGEFLAWWESMPGESPGLNIDEPHPEDPSQRKGLWPLAWRWVEGALPGGYQDYGGAGLEGHPSGHAVEYVAVTPVLPEKLREWPARWPHILRVSLRLGELNVEGEPWSNQEGRSPILAVVDGSTLRLHVALIDWESQQTDETRQRYILGAVQAAFHRFEEVTGVLVLPPAGRG